MLLGEFDDNTVYEPDLARKKKKKKVLWLSDIAAMRHRTELRCATRPPCAGIRVQVILHKSIPCILTNPIVLAKWNYCIDLQTVLVTWQCREWDLS